MKRCVRVYIEGGATGRTADNDFRRGWKKFLTSLHELARSSGFQTLEVVRGKGRANTFERFSKHHREYPDDLSALLADSECPAPEAQGVWETVAGREGDRWQKPDWAREEYLYLMVHFVETWIVTDQEALGRYFGDRFRPKSIPTTALETRSKEAITQALETATRECANGPYRHGQPHEIMEYVRSERVRSLHHGRRLFATLGELITGSATE